MRFFSKSLVDNLRIVSGLFSTDFSLVFSPVGARHMFRFSSFYRFTAISLPVKALKSPVNRNWNSVYAFSLFDQCRYCQKCRFWLSFPHSWVYHYLHSSRFWQCLCLCRHFLLHNYPEIGLPVAFYGFAGATGFPFSLALRQFVRFASVERLPPVTAVSVLPDLFRFQIFGIQTVWLR